MKGNKQHSVRRLMSLVLAGVLGFSLSGAQANSNNDWWFDVEVIVFKRDTALSQLEEQFSFAPSLNAYPADVDLIAQTRQPNIAWLKQGLQKCNAAPYPAFPEPVQEEAAQDAEGVTNEEELLVSTDETDEVIQPANELASTDELINAFPEPNNADVVYVDESQNGENPVDDALEPPLDGIFTQDTLEESLETELVYPSAEQIASYWLDAFWSMRDDEQTRPLPVNITIPEFTFCEPDTPWLTYSENKWTRTVPNNTVPLPLYIPVVTEGADWQQANHAHLLTQAAFEQTGLSRQIRQQRNLTRLLHIAWRQPVEFGKDNAFNVRLFGGNDYGKNFDEEGRPIPQQSALERQNALAALLSELSSTNIGLTSDEHEPQDTLFERLDARLSSPIALSFDEMMALANKDENTDISAGHAEYAPHKPIWELDGYLKVYLKYIGRVPYLHIDSHLLYRQPISETEQTAPTLVSIPFSEERRVISKQLHYFDHPLFGMIVQIRRHKRPVSE